MLISECRSKNIKDTIQNENVAELDNGLRYKFGTPVLEENGMVYLRDVQFIDNSLPPSSYTVINEFDNINNFINSLTFYKNGNIYRSDNIKPPFFAMF